MAQEQNYQVNYSINVDASQGTKQVMAFGEAVGKLVQAKASLTPAVTNIKHMMDRSTGTRHQENQGKCQEPLREEGCRGTQGGD